MSDPEDQIKVKGNLTPQNMASQEEGPTSENEHTSIADEWGKDACGHIPHLIQSFPKSSIATSISFLNLPRELRDIIYRHLLSTKYTKHVVREPSMVSTLLIFDAARLT